MKTLLFLTGLLATVLAKKDSRVVEHRGASCKGDCSKKVKKDICVTKAAKDCVWKWIRTGCDNKGGPSGCAKYAECAQKAYPKGACRAAKAKAYIGGYDYSNRKEALAACRANYYDRLCYYNEAWSRCAAGWFADMKGYYMSTQASGCGRKGFNYFHGSKVGAYCCNGPQPCVVSMYSSSWYGGHLLFSGAFENTDSKIVRMNRHVEDNTSSVRLSKQCYKVKLIDEDDCTTWSGDNIDLYSSRGSFGYDLNNDICGFTRVVRVPSLNKLGRPKAPQDFVGEHLEGKLLGTGGRSEAIILQSANGYVAPKNTEDYSDNSLWILVGVLIGVSMMTLVYVSYRCCADKQDEQLSYDELEEKALINPSQNTVLTVGAYQISN